MSPAAIFYNGPDTLYLFVDLIFKLSRRAQGQLFACPEVLLLRASHLRDKVEKFPAIHCLLSFSLPDGAAVLPGIGSNLL